MSTHNNDAIHSTGRGGAGNIGADPTTTYVDGSITHEGVYGQPGHPGGGDYSAGRGGAGNVVPSPQNATPVDPKAQIGSVPPTKLSAGENAADSIPEPAMREQTPRYDDFHTGRGGQGNVHKDKYGGHSSKAEQDAAEKQKEKQHGGLLEKAKHAMGLDKKSS